MTDFEYLNWILNDKYYCQFEQHPVLIEDQEEILAKTGEILEPQKVEITYIKSKISNFVLYRFHRDGDNDFLPFFNPTTTAPKSLRAFCDYIALAEYQDRVICFLFELKRGKNGNYAQQLAGGETFMNSVLDSAERIKYENRMSDFRKDNIQIRKVEVKKTRSNKKPTNRRELLDSDKTKIIPCYCTDKLHLIQLI